MSSAAAKLTARRPDSSFVGDHSAPKTLGAPDAGAKALELHDLAVVHEEVHGGAVGFDVPGEHRRIGGLEHYPLQAKGVRDPGDDVGAPTSYIFGDSLGLDHELIGPCIQKTA